MKLNPPQHDVIVSQQGELAQITAERDQLKQQLAQAQAALKKSDINQWGFRLKCDTCGDLFNEHHEGESCPGAFYKDCKGTLQFNTPPGWLSPDEAKRLRTALHDIFELASRQKSNRDCAIDEGLIDTAIAAVRVIRKVCDEKKDEAKALQADAAAMRGALVKWKAYFQASIPTNADQQEEQAEQFTQAWFDAEQALSTTAGRSLLERLESLRKLLFYVAYHRLPLSDTTLFDDLDLERQKQIHKALEGDKQ